MLLKGLSSFNHTKKSTWSCFRCHTIIYAASVLLLGKAHIDGRSGVIFTSLNDISSQMAFHGCVLTTESSSARRIELQNNPPTLRIYFWVDKVLVHL